jgi:hemerythrin superfamily protein
MGQIFQRLEEVEAEKRREEAERASERIRAGSRY